MDLVREFAANGSEAAFATLVGRHVNLVYSAALRRLGNPHEAEEVAQAVFIILAKKAGSLRRGTILSGWLYQTAQFTAANFQRAALRRQHREQEAYMQFSDQSEPDVSWHRLSPLLEEALARLGQRERDAVVLRFFENRTVREVATALGLREDAAQKRINRATGKLRDFFIRRGVQVSTAALLTSIGTHAVQAAPAALTKSITAVAVTKGAAVSGSTLTLVKGVLKIMAWTKAKTAIVVGVGVLLAAGTTSVVVNRIKSPSVDESLWEMKLENLRKAPPVLIIRPTRFSDHGSMMSGNGLIAHNLDLKGLFEWGYASLDQDESIHTYSRKRMILPEDAPQNGYDLMFILPDHSAKSPQQAAKTLQQGITQKTGFAARKETRETDVLLLSIKDPGLLALHVSRRGSKRKYQSSDGLRAWTNFPISHVADYLEFAFDKPVIVQPGLSGNYDITFQWEDAQGKKQAMADELAQAGLELVPSRETIEMLVVEKTN
ncbi:MAG: sigma-70 family RNA polymerase sigma factor [Limisphaerales bacterium]